MNGLPEDVLQYIEKELKISSPDPWVMFDKEGTITDVNEATIRLAGKTRKELIGSPFADCFTDPEKTQECVNLTLKTGKLQDYELSIKGRDMTETIVAYNASVFKDLNGQVVGAFATGRDVTDRKKTQQKLRETIKRIHYKYRFVQSECNNAKSECNEAQQELQETINRLEAYTVRINNMLVTMLEQISEKKTSVVILDISGLSADVEVSDDLVNIARSARQLGGTCIISGVKSERVNKLTDLGVKLSPLTTDQSLKNGLRYTIAIAEEES
ncbi:MAG: PAS domain S-box protein [ANME-2 cluster archaeon]|nr:PAS domain S-box protein [ANME-2 cluster archaeon]